MRTVRYLALALVVMGGLSASAAVKTEEKTQMHFTGFLGGMMKMFGGKSANEGVTETVAVKGNRKSNYHDTNGQIVDLDEEKVYEVDVKGKSYKVMTFDEIRRKFAEQQEKAKQEMAKAKDAPPSQSAPPENQMEFDFSIKESGQKKVVNGFDCKEVVMTITVHQKGKKVEDSGGMVTTMSVWQTPRIAAMKEIADFDLRYYKKLALPFDPAMMQQMAAVMAANPYLMQSMVKVKDETAKLDGTAVLTTTTFETVAGKEAAAEMAKQDQQKKEDEHTTTIPTSIGGLFGGLAKKAVQKKTEEKPSDGAASTPGRATLMSSDTELLKVSGDVADADVAIPAGFKMKN